MLILGNSTVISEPSECVLTLMPGVSLLSLKKPINSINLSLLPMISISSKDRSIYDLPP
jgi:hypothetical protein